MIMVKIGHSLPLIVFPLQLWKDDLPALLTVVKCLPFQRGALHSLTISKPWAPNEKNHGLFPVDYAGVVPRCKNVMPDAISLPHA
jgi:hypothetical protein